MVISQSFSSVLIERRLMEQIKKIYCESKNDYEIGGLLLGYRRGTCLHVSTVTLPGKNDLSKKYSFVRKNSSHQVKATWYWYRSMKKVGWLGEWHTHPQKIAQPSSIDISSWRKMAFRTKSVMVFIILGNDEDWIGVVIPQTRKIKKLTCIEESSKGKLYA